MKTVTVKLVIEIDGVIHHTVSTIDYTESVQQSIADEIVDDDNDAICEYIMDDFELVVNGD